jgi:hypothetical protein
LPHSREVIENALQDFKVETWDWKQVDICSSTLLKAAPGVRALSLYASGNTAVFKGWSCAEGLAKLELVRLQSWPRFCPDILTTTTAGEGQIDCSSSKFALYSKISFVANRVATGFRNQNSKKDGSGQIYCRF